MDRTSSSPEPLPLLDSVPSWAKQRSWPWTIQGWEKLDASLADHSLIGAPTCQLRFIDCLALLRTDELRVAPSDFVDGFPQLGLLPTGYDSTDIELAYHRDPMMRWGAVSYSQLSLDAAPSQVDFRDTREEPLVDYSDWRPKRTRQSSDSYISPYLLREVCKAIVAKGVQYVWIYKLCALQDNAAEHTWLVSLILPTIFRLATPCLVLPAGLGRLASLYEETAYLRCTWALLPLAVIERREHLLVLHQDEQRPREQEQHYVPIPDAESSGHFSTTSSFESLLKCTVLGCDYRLHRNLCIFGQRALTIPRHANETSTSFLTMTSYQTATSVYAILANCADPKSKKAQPGLRDSVFAHFKSIWIAVSVRASANPIYVSVAVLAHLLHYHYAQFCGEYPLGEPHSIDLSKVFNETFRVGEPWTEQQTKSSLYRLLRSLIRESKSNAPSNWSRSTSAVASQTARSASSTQTRRNTDEAVSSRVPKHLFRLFREGLAHSLPRRDGVCVLPDFHYLRKNHQVFRVGPAETVEIVSLAEWCMIKYAPNEPEFPDFMNLPTDFHPSFRLDPPWVDKEGIHLRFWGHAVSLRRVENERPGRLGEGHHEIAATDDSRWEVLDAQTPQQEDTLSRAVVVSQEMLHGVKIRRAMVLQKRPSRDPQAPYSYTIRSWIIHRDSGKGSLQDVWWDSWWMGGGCKSFSVPIMDPDIGPHDAYRARSV